MFYRKQVTTVSVIVTLVWGCAAYQPGSLEDPRGFNFISQQTEIQMGLEAAQEVEAEMQIIDDPYIQNYIGNLGHYLVQYSRRPNLSYQFKVVDTDEINAFALPGGFIYVNRGLIAEASNEAELAGVLAHEIGHVAAKHGAQRMSTLIALQLGFTAFEQMNEQSRNAQIQLLAAQAVATGFLLKNSRDNERQADDYGTENLYLAGYEPLAMARFFDKLARDYSPSKVEVFLSTHPSPGERVRNVERLVASFSPKPYITNSAEFQQIQYRLSSKNYKTSPYSRSNQPPYPERNLPPAPIRSYRRR
jgi:predicted Zn-dependent protease